ncbi:hypothetical protein ACFL59_02730 [Planctomycetota bacterium]
MDLKKHGFWVAMGAGALVALILYYVLVVAGVNSDIRKKEIRLKKAVKELGSYVRIDEEVAGDPYEGLPIKETVQYFRMQRERLGKEREEVLRRYREKDAHLEKINPKQDVEEAKFYGYTRDKLDELSKLYKQILPEGKTFEDVVPVFGGNPLKTAKEIPFAQKKYYIGEAIAAVATAAGATRLVAVEFAAAPKELTEEQRESFLVQRLGVTVQLLMPTPGVAGKKADAARKSALQKLGVDKSSPGGVAALVSGFLKHPKLVFELAELTVAKASFAYPELAPWKVFPERGGLVQAGQRLSFDKDVYVATQNTQDPEAKEPPGDMIEPPVKVTVKLNVLDFHIPPEEAE